MAAQGDNPKSHLCVLAEWVGRVGVPIKLAQGRDQCCGHWVRSLTVLPDRAQPWQRGREGEAQEPPQHP